MKKSLTVIHIPEELADDLQVKCPRKPNPFALLNHFTTPLY